MVHELLAQLLEEVSVLAADRRRKKPRQVPRPSDRKRATRPSGDPNRIVGFRSIIAAHAGAGRVRVTGG